MVLGLSCGRLAVPGRSLHWDENPFEAVPKQVQEIQRYGNGELMFRVRYGSKYGAKKQEFNGVSYHSKKEAGYASDLHFRHTAGEIKDWERQVKVSLDVNGYHIANYYVDFLIHHNDGRKEYVEVKGFETPEWRLKWKLFEALYSKEKDLILTVVK